MSTNQCIQHCKKVYLPIKSYAIFFPVSCWGELLNSYICLLLGLYPELKGKRPYWKEKACVFPPWEHEVLGN